MVEIATTREERLRLIKKIAEDKKKTMSKRKKISYNESMDAKEIVDNFSHTTSLDNDWD